MLTHHDVETARLAWLRTPCWWPMRRYLAKRSYQQLDRIYRGMTWQDRVRAGDRSGTYLDRP